MVRQRRLPHEEHRQHHHRVGSDESGARRRPPINCFRSIRMSVISVIFSKVWGSTPTVVGELLYGSE